MTFDMLEPKHAAYAPASEGPFECEHCGHYRAKDSHCLLPENVRLKLHIPGLVEPHACCDLFVKNTRSIRFTADDVRKVNSHGK
jgi:hypothetical protein